MAKTAAGEDHLVWPPLYMTVVVLLQMVGCHATCCLNAYSIHIALVVGVMKMGNIAPRKESN